ncbi:hypothetical protein ACEU6F_11300, partial [Aeromonas salmonicida]|uniref:hypothetical protein n=1 Tax=Aeromonas salmonicida TaxID=645 RepID=UPI0035A6B018
GERSSGSTYDLGNVSDSGSLSRYSKSTVRRHRRVSHFEVEFAESGFNNFQNFSGLKDEQLKAHLTEQEIYFGLSYKM